MGRQFKFESKFIKPKDKLRGIMVGHGDLVCPSCGITVPRKTFGQTYCGNVCSRKARHTNYRPYTA